MSKQCCVNVWHKGNSFRGYYKQCTRTATFQRDGKVYCKQHDPVHVEARRQKAMDDWRAKSNETAKQHRLEAAAPDLLAACCAVTTDGRDANANGDVTIPSSAWDLIRAAIAKATGEQS
jgi:hypothetical protein